MTFFPDFTDHGLDHINSVLSSQVDLIPKYIFDPKALVGHLLWE